MHGSRTEDLHAAARQLAADVHPDNAEVVRVHDDVARAKEVARALHECDEQLRELRAAMPSGVRGATLQRGERERLRLEIAQVEGRRSVWEQESTRTGDADIGMALLSAHREALGMIASELRERNVRMPGDDRYIDEAIVGERYSSPTARRTAALRVRTRGQTRGWLQTEDRLAIRAGL